MTLPLPAPTYPSLAMSGACPSTQAAHPQLTLVEGQGKKAFVRRVRTILRAYGIAYRFFTGEDGMECIALNIPDGALEAMQFKDSAYLARHEDVALADGMLRHRILKLIDCAGNQRPAADHTAGAQGRAITRRRAER